MPEQDWHPGVDPEHEALLADSVGLAMLVVLDFLSDPDWLARLDIASIGLGGG